MTTLGNFVWSIADQLRGVYKPHQYGNVILPFTILRRMDAILEPTRDEVRALAKETAAGPRLDRAVHKATGLRFYNTSKFDFAKLLADPEGLEENLVDYINRFSENIDVFERFKFEGEIATLAEKDRLYQVVSQFAEVDLHPDRISNADMGDLFEELIRRFAEASNEEAGEHFTPRDAIRLIVDLIFAEEQEGPGAEAASTLTARFADEALVVSAGGRAARGAQCDLGLLPGLALVSPGFGALPSTVFSGHTLKAGHFSQPATMAMGHTVMGVSSSARCAADLALVSRARQPKEPER